MNVIHREKLSTFLMSIIFIFLYGSGFVAAKMGFPYIKPMLFLSVRYVITTVILLIFAFVLKSKWPSSLKETLHIAIAGIFLVCIYSASAWISMDMGIPPAFTALITSLQPIVVSLISWVLFKKIISGRQWVGLILGLAGVVLVVGAHAKFNAQYNLGILWSVLSLISLSIGNLYQKTFCHSMNIITGGIIQSIASGIISFICAWYFEPHTIIWSGEFIFSLTWMTVVISVGANSILYILLRRGESHTVASLFYLIPAVTAMLAFLIFGSTLSLIQILGMVTSVVGVGLVNFSFSRVRKKIES